MRVPWPFRERTRLLRSMVLLAVSLGVGSSTLPQEAVESIAAAREALASGRAEEAIARLERLAAEHPRWADVALLLGHGYRQRGDRAAAAKEYLRGRELDPGSYEFLVALGQLEEDAGNVEQALVYHERAIEAAPGSAASYGRAARMQLALERYEAAVDNLERYVRLEPEDADAHSALARAHWRNGNAQAAIAFLRRAIELAPGLAEAHYGLGVVLATQPSQTEGALRHLQIALDSEIEEAADAHRLIGRLLANRGELEAAIASLEASLRLDPDQPGVLYSLAQLQTRSGHETKGSETMQRFLRLRQRLDTAEAASRRRALLESTVIQAALHEGDERRAEGALRELLDAWPSDPDVLVLAAKVWSAAGRPIQALAAIDEALQAEPGHSEALYLRGLFLFQAGRLDESMRALGLSLQADPLFAQAHAIRGNVLMAEGDHAMAVEAYRFACSLEPDNPGHYLNLASAYARLGWAELEAEARAGYRRLSERRERCC